MLVSCSVPSEPADELSVDNLYYDAAFEFLNRGKVDSAFSAFSQAKEIFAANHDSLRAGYCLLQMAIMQSDRGDYYGGQETSFEALSFFNTADSTQAPYLTAIYNNLGIATFSLKDYDGAIRFYDLAIRYSLDSLHTLTYLNNKARAYHSKGDFDRAIAIYEQIQTDSDHHPRAYARTLTNLALAHWRKNPTYNAAPDFHVALQIREKETDRWGLNSSYTHLSDYYAASRPDSALYYAHNMYSVAQLLNSADDQIRALYRLIRLSPPDAAKHYFEAYKSLTDSVQLARATAKNQFALIRYEVEKNKAENLMLQKENAEKAFQVTRQRTWTGAVLALALLVVGGGTFWYRKRAQRMALEAGNRIKGHQLKTSKKIHDVVANGLYRVMAEIENRDDINREDVLDRLEHMYEQSRDISYETEGVPLHGPDYHNRVAELLKSFATDSTKVIIAGNSLELWEGTGEYVKSEVAHILQELMVNMHKHSHATNVVVRFEQIEHQLHIHYRDNGIGLPSSFTKGNGLANTGNRIESLRGQITFANERDIGLKIEIALPVS